MLTSDGFLVQMVLARWLGVLSLVCWLVATSQAARVVEQEAPKGNRATVTQPAGVRVDIASSLSDQAAEKHFALLNRMLEVVVHPSHRPVIRTHIVVCALLQSSASIRAEAHDAKTVESLRNGKWLVVQE